MLITLKHFFSIFLNGIFGFSLNSSPFKPRHWSSLNICLHNRNSLPLHEFFFSVPPTSLGDLLPQRICWYRGFGGSGVTEGKPDKDPACIPFPADDSDVCFSGGIPLCCNSIRNTGTSQRYLHCRFVSSWKKYLLNLFYMYAISYQMHFAHK